VTRWLIDTHAVLWWLTDSPELTQRARAVIADSTNDLLVSSVCVWEIAIKRALGKLEAPEDLLAVIEAEGFGWLPVTPRHAWVAGALPHHHSDPFDRLLIAQALTEGLVVLTADQAIGAYGVGVCW